MKTKKFSKKLELNKKNIAQLNGPMMDNVNGGMDTITCGIYTGPDPHHTCDQTICGLCPD